MPVTILVRAIAARLDDSGHLRIGAASLEWDRAAPGKPLVLELDDAVLRRTDGSVAAAAARAVVGLRLRALLLGRLRPVRIALQGASIALLRTSQGVFALDLGSTPQPPARASAPARGTRLWRHLHTVDLAGVAATVTDRRLGLTWRATIDADARGLSGPDPSGNAKLRLALDSAQDSRTLTIATVTAALRAPPQGQPQGHDLTAAWTGFNPARLASAPPLAALRGFDLPLAGTASAHLTQDWGLDRGTATLTLGPGRIAAQGILVPVAGATASLSVAATAHGATRIAATLDQARLTLADTTGRPGPAIAADGAATWSGTTATATLNLHAVGLHAADLPRFWPAGLSGQTRAWLAANVTQGTVDHADVTLGLKYDPLAAAPLTLSRATGQLHAAGVTLYWLRPVPPITGASATLTLLSPDAVTILVPAATQAPSDPAQPALAIRDARLRITGLQAREQIGSIEADVSGSLAQALALLRENRLHLLATHPIDLGTASGAQTIHVEIRLPLDSRDTMDQVRVRATATATAVHLGGVAAGRDLDDGTLTLAAGNDGATASGTALLAGIPATLTAAMDFRAGPPQGASAIYTAAGQASASQLAAAGLPIGGLVDGKLAYRGTITEQRNGAGLAAVALDLGGAALRLAALGWSKPAGAPAQAAATLLLDHDRLSGLTGLTVTGPALSVHGSATVAPGQSVTLALDRVVLGQSRATGTVTLPQAPGAPVRIRLRGPILDLSAQFQNGAARQTPTRAQARQAAQTREATARAPATRGRRWIADLAFDTVTLAHGHALRGVTAQAEDDGLKVARAEGTGQVGNGAFHMTLQPLGAGRRLAATAADAGGLLQALDLTGAVQGGTVGVTAVFDDASPDHALSGTATMENFRVVGATAIARVLQGMTLYGLVDVLRGPGLAISHLVAPFRYADQVLTLSGARAYSSSLGFTAAGTIDLAAQRADLAGTIVPGYFFNALLGKVPVLGKLFSAEKGGGVFAANYTLSGALTRPEVHINPLSALAPGFLRDIFGGQETGGLTGKAQ